MIGYCSIYVHNKASVNSKMRKYEFWFFVNILEDCKLENPIFPRFPPIRLLGTRLQNNFLICQPASFIFYSRMNMMLVDEAKGFKCKLQPSTEELEEGIIGYDLVPHAHLWT